MTRSSFLLFLMIGFGVPAVSQAQYNRTFPHFAAGGGWSSDIYLTCQDSQGSFDVNISFIGDDGNPMSVATNLGTISSTTLILGAGETVLIQADASGSLKTGYVLIEHSPDASIRGSEIFRYRSGDTIIAQIGVALQRPSQHFTFPAEIDTSNGVNTGIALANPVIGSDQNRDQAVKVSLIGQDGSLYESATVNLAAGQHVARFLHEIFPGLASFSGSVSVSSPEWIGVLGLRQDGSVYGGLSVDTGAVLAPWRLWGALVAEVEPNNDRAQAQLLGASLIVGGTISSATDVDYFSFTGKRDDTVSFLLDTQILTSELDSVLRLEKSDGTLVSENDQNGLLGRNDSFIQAILPADGTYYLRVSDYWGDGGTEYPYRLHARLASSSVPAPEIASLSPTGAKAGTTVNLTIQGSNLSGVTSVNITSSSGITITGIQAGQTQVTCSVTIASSAAATMRSVTVTSPGGISNSLTFAVTSATAAPQINSMTESGRQGQTVLMSIGGSNLGGATAVNFNPGSGITVTGIQSTNTLLTCNVAISASAATGARTVTVTGASGTSNALTFTVITSSTVPQIDSISPIGARQGATITLNFTGLNLWGMTAVTFSPSSGITISDIRMGSTLASCNVVIGSTAAIGARSITVTTPSGTSNTATFSVIAASGTSAPTVSNLTWSVFTTTSGKDGISGSFDFSDADGDIVYTGSDTGSARILFRMSGSQTCSITNSGAYLDKAGLTSGHISFSFTFNASTMYVGSFTVSFQLTDASGNQSNSLPLNPAPTIWHCENHQQIGRPGYAADFPDACLPGDRRPWRTPLRAPVVGRSIFAG